MDTSCATCGKPIHVKPKVYKPGRNYCSRACHYASGAPRPNQRTGTNKTCEVCGAVFYTVKARAAARFCSRRCKGIASRLPKKTCAVCGESFQPHFGQAARPTCSRACGAAHHKRGQEFPCGICGKPVYIPKGRLGQPMYFCGNAHASEWQGRNKTSHTCLMCGKAFRWSPSRHKAGNIKYCSLACRNADPAQRARLLAMNARQQAVSPTSIERIGYALLDRLGVAYQRQALFAGKFCVDAQAPAAKVVIQFDGDYWHDRAGASSEPRILKRVRLDKSQDAYIRRCGWRVLRLWESDLKRRPDWCRDQMKAALA